MKPGNKNSYKALQTISIDGIDYKYYGKVSKKKQ